MLLCACMLVIAKKVAMAVGAALLSVLEGRHWL